MNGYGNSEEHQPITYLRGYPVYAAHIVVAVFVFSMIATAIVVRFGLPYFFEWLPFVSTRVLAGQVWRAFTYGLVNPPTLQFVIDMVLIVWFGREVEKHLGRRMFLGLYAGLYLVTPVLLTVVGLWFPMAFGGATGALAIFTAFATIYPNVTVMFNLLAKWAAAILVGTFSLIHFAYHEESALLSLWATNAFAFAFVRHYQGLLELPRLRLWKRKPKLRALPDLPATKRGEPSSTDDASMSDVDALLDKIAKSGIGSLTARERARLERGRENLLKKESGRR